MASIRQYFETDFDYALRVKAKIELETGSYECAVLFDISAPSAFMAILIEDKNKFIDKCLNLIRSLKFGSTPLHLDKEIALPNCRQCPADLQIGNFNPLVIQYRMFGDTVWNDLFKISSTRRVFIYFEADLSEADFSQLQAEAFTQGISLQLRGTTYMKERARFEVPLAFISHDSRDKQSIARPIAINLQRKLCPVWYDEFSLALGDNLRQSIEKGLKECKKCVLVLSKNFFSNNGWGKREFESIFTREIIEESALVLPIWFDITAAEVYNYSPSLANVKGIDWKLLGEEEVCRQIYLAVSTSIKS